MQSGRPCILSSGSLGGTYFLLPVRLFAHLKTLYLKTHGSLQQEGVIVAGKVR